MTASDDFPRPHTSPRKALHSTWKPEWLLRMVYGRIFTTYTEPLARPAPRPYRPACSVEIVHIKRQVVMTDRHKLIFFAPPTNLADIQAAIFATGAGTMGKYTECCYTTPGIGQFRPAPDANSATGEPGKLEQVGEVRCEIICGERSIVQAAIDALKQ